MREKEGHHEAEARLEAARTELRQRDEQVAQLQALFSQVHQGREQVCVERGSGGCCSSRPMMYSEEFDALSPTPTPTKPTTWYPQNLPPGTTKQVGQRLQQAYNEVAAAEERERGAVDRARRLERRLEEKGADVERLQRLLAQLDEERDGLQAALDEQAEAAAQAAREQARLARQQRRLEEDLEAARARAAEAAEQAAGREREGRVLKERAEGLALEAGEARKAVWAKQLELRGCVEELHVVAQESQAQQAELGRLKGERDGLWRQLEGARRELEGFRQGLARAGREKADLEAAYRAACEDAERCVPWPWVVV